MNISASPFPLSRKGSRGNGLFTTKETTPLLESRPHPSDKAVTIVAPKVGLQGEIISLEKEPALIKRQFERSTSAGNREENAPTTTAVATADPFPRKRQENAAKSTRASSTDRQVHAPTSTRLPTSDLFSRGDGCRKVVFNPGSCSSGLNLLTPSELTLVNRLSIRDAPCKRQENAAKSARVSSTDRRANAPRTILVPTSNPCSRVDGRSKVVLNPGSCSSGLNLLTPSELTLFDSLASLHPDAPQASPGTSTVRTSFGASQRYSSSTGLLGSARLLYTSSLSRGGDTRNNHQGRKRNADWGVFQ